jgi:beta-lactamase regulating signal transducer with metallopeptidase domain
MPTFIELLLSLGFFEVTAFFILAVILIGQRFLNQPLERIRITQAGFVMIGCVLIAVAVPVGPRLRISFTKPRQDAVETAVLVKFQEPVTVLPQNSVPSGNARALHPGWDDRSESHEPVCVAHWDQKAEQREMDDSGGRMERSDDEATVRRGFPATVQRAMLPMQQDVFPLQLLAVTVLAVFCLPPFGLLIREIHARVSLSGILKRSHPVSENVRKLFREISGPSGGTVYLRCSRETDVPVIFGFFRATLLLPAAMGNTVSSELRACLTHEWSHLKRGDLRTSNLIRWFQYPLWPQPFYRRLRARLLADQDYLADHEGAMQLSDRAEYARILLELAQNRIQNLSRNVLGMAGHKSQLKRRIEMLLDPTKPLALQPRKRHLIPAVLLMIPLTILGGSVRFGESAIPAEEKNDETAKENHETADESAAEKKETGETPKRLFTVTILGPDQKPLREFPLTLRVPPYNSGGVFLTGFPKKDEKEILTDREGKIYLEIPPGYTGQIVIDMIIPGYAPYWAMWWDSQRVPEELTVQLDAAVSIGGIVVDSDGVPIEGVSVSPQIYYKTPKEILSNTGTVTSQKTKTDADGKWRINSVPESMETVWTTFGHPEYRSQTDTVSVRRFRLDGDEEPSQKTVLEPGLVLKGRVLDEQENPVAGASVRILPEHGKEEARVVRTDEEGNYRLIGSNASQLLVTAAGFAPASRPFTGNFPDVTMEDIRLSRGKPVKIHVVDQDGKPCPNAQVSLTHWSSSGGEYQFNSTMFPLCEEWKTHTDQDGDWIWNNAPKGRLKFAIFFSGSAPVFPELAAGEKEHVITLPPITVVSGKVTDAETGRPVPRFKLVPTYKNSRGYRWHLSRESAEEFREGEYTFSFNLFSEGMEERGFRIEADGYRIAHNVVSGGRSQKDIALHPAKNIEGMVYLPRKAGESVRKPAQNAMVILSTKGSEPIYRENVGMLSGNSGMQVHTDEQGRFSFPNPGEPFALVAESGMAFASDWQKDFDAGKKFELELASSRLEGTLFVGRKPAQGISVTFSQNTHFPDGNKEIDENFQFRLESVTTVTGRDGTFVFESLPPGHGEIGHIAGHESGRNWSLRDAPLELPANQTTVVRFGLERLEAPNPFVFPTDTEPRPGVHLEQVNGEHTVPSQPGIPGR